MVMREKLGNLYKISSGGTPLKSIREYYEGGTIKWVKTGDLKQQYLYDSEDCITEVGLSKSSARMYEENTVLIAMYGATIGATSILKIPACTNQACAAFPPINSVIPEYLYYFLRSKKSQFVKDGVGGAQPNISGSYLKNVELDLLDVKEQRKIVNILDKLGKIILGREQQMKQLDNLIKSRFVEMFGDPKTNPKKWQEGTVRDIVTEVKYGTSKPAIEGGRYKYIRMNNITYNGELDLSNLKYIDIPEIEVEKCIVRKGDVLFNRTNSKELVGKTCVFNQEESMVIAGYIIRVRMNDKALPEYLSAVLNSRYGKETLFGMCKAIVGQANINAQELQNIKIVIPPLVLQQEFVRFKDQVDKLKFRVQESLNETQLLFESMMQKYFD
jgi:type I restriction enzyme S subunit